MKYKDLMLNLMVKDIGKTLDFYKNILGFNVLATVPENGPFVLAIEDCNGYILTFAQQG
jgi:catechol 2,3-dioxygenase-like lactoylglutathione lyase family enzyme